MADEIVERWLPVPGFEGMYSVSDHGRLIAHPRSFTTAKGAPALSRERVLKFFELPKGYRYFNLFKEGACTRVYVHRLVLLAFVGPPPSGTQACHNNGVRSENHLQNLRWDTPAGNTGDKWKHGTIPVGEAHGGTRLSDADVALIRADKRSSSALAREMNVSVSHVCSIRRGRKRALMSSTRMGPHQYELPRTG